MDSAHMHHPMKDQEEMKPMKAGEDMDHGEMMMSHAFSKNLPMTRNGSGTGWLPDASPMYGKMFHSKKWMYMLHGNAFLRYTHQDVFNAGRRGNDMFDLPNWIMFMGQRNTGKNGLFHFSAMLSLDAAIAGGAGYPLLFQSGESYRGQPLVDRQHPHDLFSELAVSYSHAFSKKVDAFIYLGYPGEPALGPVAFMHRPSALDNPDAPITHHWVDATHITFGVATLGLRIGNVKVEASSFTGREPDEERYGFDKPRFDSWSGRLSFNPSPNWALQVSHAFLESPEALHPGQDVHKTTASAIYSVNLPSTASLNATLLWGLNKVKKQDGENAVLAEASWRKNRLAFHSRYEYVEKSAEELLLGNEFDHHEIFPVHAITAGFNYDLFKIKHLNIAGGAQSSLYFPDQRLRAVYGNTPVAVEVFLRLYPGLGIRN